MPAFSDLRHSIHASWWPTFDLAEEELDAIEAVLKAKGNYLPPREDLFAALQLSLSETRVVMIAESPFPKAGIAHGLCLSSAGEMQASQEVIWRELERTEKRKVRQIANLSHWRAQGVLMLNASLTLFPNKEALGIWQGFYAYLLQTLYDHCSQGHKLVFVFIGAFARNMVKYIHETAERVILPHPSPRNRSGFVGCDMFVQINAALDRCNLPRIQWEAPEK